MLELLRERLAELPEVRLAAAFGSVARGEERPGSDLDLALLLETDCTPRWEIEAALGRTADREVDFIYLNEAPPLLRFEIATDGVLLLERHPGDWSDVRALAMIDWWDWAPTARRITETILRRQKERLERGKPEVAAHRITGAHARKIHYPRLLLTPASLLKWPERRLMTTTQSSSSTRMATKSAWCSLCANIRPCSRNSTLSVLTMLPRQVASSPGSRKNGDGSRDVIPNWTPPGFLSPVESYLTGVLQINTRDGSTFPYVGKEHL